MCAVLLVSCVSKDERMATIKGQFTGDASNVELHLSKVEHGKRVKVASTTLSKDGYFGFIYPIDEPGIYVVNTTNSATKRPAIQDHHLKRFYLEPGTEITINMDAGSYELIDTNSDKNKLLSLWNMHIDTVFTYSHGFMYARTTYKDFYPLLPRYVAQAEQFSSTVSSGDASFDELMKLMIDVDITTAALRFIQTPRTEHAKREDYPEFYDIILTDKIPSSPRLMELPDGIGYMRSFTMYATTSMAERPAVNQQIYFDLDHINNDLLKGYYVVNNLRSFKSYDRSYLDFKEMVTPYLQNEYLKNTFEEYEISIRKFETGAEGYDFVGKDINGKEWKLSDFRGKLVYVDVWATWCQPCKKEIPALKVLEKKYHGKPIVFLSISLDKAKDHQKWVNYVKNEELKGVQLIADKDFNSDVAKVYGINAIPRFMLFDKEGKIITTDAPRPSQKETEVLLKKHL